MSELSVKGHLCVAGLFCFVLQLSVRFKRSLFEALLGQGVVINHVDLMSV